MVAAISARQALANAADPQPASTSAFQQALAYAPPSAPIDRANIVAASAPMPRGTRPATLARNPMAVTSITTVIAKGSHGQISAMTTSTRLSAAVIRDDDVWMRVMILAPSATTSMTATVMSDENDLTVMRAHFAKPETTVTMSFSDDPQLGMVSDRFTGPAIATVATTPFLRTASLR
jgi:hypothetical protein